MASESEALSLAGSLIRAGKIEDAYKKLQSHLEKMEGELAETAMPSYQYALGRMSYEMGELERARKHFEASNGKGSLFKNWSNYYLGSIARQNNENKSAKGKLLSLAGRRKPTRLRLDARRELAMASMQRGHWREARRHLYYLERRTRGGSEYPQIVWWLVRAELKSKRKWKACRYARRLYSRYPNNALVSEWGIDLQNADFEGKKLGCIATTTDQRRRIERLQMGGNAAQAEAEIKTLKKRVGESGSVYVDLLYARFHARQGHTNEALKLLLKHYESQKNSFNYLMQLAKAAQAAGEYHAAVGAYERAHAKNPRSRSGRKALFQAAFTSYRFQDYDGATERFKRFQRKYRRSGLTRDVAWHLAWIKYLRGDFKGAYKKFSWILRQKNRYRRRWRSFAKDRIQYWMAMSLFRNSEVKKAAKIFAGMYNERSISYYSLLARHRLASISDPAVRELASVRAVFEENPFLDDEGIMPVQEGQANAGKDLEEEESEESLAKIPDEEGVVADSDIEDEDSKEEDEEQEDLVTDASFKSVKLSQHFERAKKFIEMGFDDSARWELYEIERKTRKEEQLKALMHHYELIGSYHRSSYIGEIYFGRQRHRYGMQGVKYLWEYTYPRAYENYVLDFSGEFSVPRELTWSIIRAESRYRKDATSPVGARGLMQMMPYTAVRVAELVGTEYSDVSQLEEPKYNIKFGTRYLMRLMKKFEQKIPLVAAGYNAGPHRVDSWLDELGHLEMDEFVDHIPFVETRNYVKKVLRNLYVYNELYGKSGTKMPWLIGKISVRPKTRNFSKENWDPIE